MQRDLDLEVAQILIRPFSKNLRKPSTLEVKKYLRLANGCPKSCVSEGWIKNMMNWDLYTHPRSEEFVATTTLAEKISLSKEWKNYMDKHQIYLSFYEWHYTRLTMVPMLKPISAPLISCPVQTLSMSELGKEIRKLKTTQKDEEKKREEETCQFKHQQYHILANIRIQDLNFRLKTLIDTGSDLNILNQHVIPVAYWEKAELTVAGLGNVLTNISY